MILVNFLPFACYETMHIKVSSAQVVCSIYLLTLQTNFSIQANCVDPDQTAQEQSDLGHHCLLQRHFKRTSRRHTVDNIYRRMAENGFAPPTLGNFADISYLVEN